MRPEPFHAMASSSRRGLRRGLLLHAPAAILIAALIACLPSAVQAREKQAAATPGPAAQPTAQPATRLADGTASRYPLGVIGEIEPVTIVAADITTDARIDTGAATSSIHAEKIEVFQRGNKRWVRFEFVIDEDEENGNDSDDDEASTKSSSRVTAASEAKPITHRIKLERQVKRVVNIKRKRAEPIKRYVVELDVVMGKVKMTRQFTLANRDNFEFPVLIGRNVLKKMALVDVSLARTLAPKDSD